MSTQAGCITISWLMDLVVSSVCTVQFSSYEKTACYIQFSHYTIHPCWIHTMLVHLYTSALFLKLERIASHKALKSKLFPTQVRMALCLWSQWRVTLTPVPAETSASRQTTCWCCPLMVAEPGPPPWCGECCTGLCSYVGFVLARYT